MHIPLNEAQQSIAKDNRAVVKLWAIKRILHRRQRQMRQAEGYATLLLHFCANRVPDDKQTRLMADAICYIVVYAISFMVYGLLSTLSQLENRACRISFIFGNSCQLDKRRSRNDRVLVSLLPLGTFPISSTECLLRFRSRTLSYLFLCLSAVLGSSGVRGISRYLTVSTLKLNLTPFFWELLFVWEFAKSLARAKSRKREETYISRFFSLLKLCQYFVALGISCNGIFLKEFYKGEASKVIEKGFELMRVGD